MAHYQQLKFVEELSKGLPMFFSGKKVLEVGSWDVNGSVRKFFKDCDYTGADIASGNGVDLVVPGQNIDFPAATFDVTVSCECFEHNPEWKATLLNMLRMLKPGGLCIISCATLGRREHGTTRTNADASLTALHEHRDYYRNLTAADFKKVVSLEKEFDSFSFITNIYGKDLYFVGIKKHALGQVLNTLPAITLENVRAITRERPVGILSQAKHRIRFHVRYAVARILGEDRFHDLRYRSPKGS